MPVGLLGLMTATVWRKAYGQWSLRDNEEEKCHTEIKYRGTFLRLVWRYSLC